MKSWNEEYSEKGQIWIWPSKDITDLAPMLEKEGVYRVLDHCCGTGRHVKYLAQFGFYAVGLDSSEKAIEIARTNCQCSNLHFTLSDMGNIPYTDGYFDAVISINGLQHGNREQREKAFLEIYRTLKPKGLFFLRTMCDKNRAYGLGESVEDDENTFMNIPNMHGGSRHFYTEDELRQSLLGYDILRFEHVEEQAAQPPFFYPLNEWRILAKKKSI